MKKRIVVLVLVIVIAGGYLALRVRKEERSALELSGTIETREIQVGSKVGGRVTEVLVEEGQPVKAGATLIRFEAEELKAQREQAEARVAQAEAELARLERGFRPEEIQQAEAAARQQQALLDAAKR